MAIALIRETGSDRVNVNTMRPKVLIISAACFSGAVYDTVPEVHLTTEEDDPPLMCLYFHLYRRA